MKNKILWVFIIVFIIAASSGFFIGRYYTIRRNITLYFEEIHEKIPVEEVKRYRQEMKRLRNLMEREQKYIIFAAKRGEREKIREHIDSISKVKKEILLETVEHLRKVSLSLPPQIRESYIEHRLKPPRVQLHKFEDIPLPPSKMLPLPPEMDKFNERAEAYFNIGDYEKAIEQYESIISKIPENVISRIKIGNVYRKLNQYDKAKEHYLDVLEIEPNNLDAYYMLIDLEISRKNLPEIKKYINEAFNVFPDVHVIFKFPTQLDTEKIEERKNYQIQSQEKEEY
ncbi:tetratricopeptide repeat protein [candidate division WOR-3 bacterium]|nr:tetratricopeptide repeat protein [candidate division WOR-3 bacterium]